MIQKELERKLLVKSMDSMKYFILSQRIARSFMTYKSSKILKGSFATWRERY